MKFEENKVYTPDELVDFYQGELKKGNVEDIDDFMKKYGLKMYIGEKCGFIKKGKEN